MRGRETSPVYWFTPPVPTMARTRPEPRPTAGKTIQVPYTGDRAGVYTDRKMELRVREGTWVSTFRPNAQPDREILT